MKQVSKVMWGVVLVVLGGVFALNALGITDIDLFFKGWWTLIIIVPSAIAMFTDKDKTGAIIGLTVGLLMLLACRGYVNFELLGKLIVPVLIIVAGVKLIFNGAFDKNAKEKMKKMKNVTGIRHCSTAFANKTDDCTNQTFNGADYVAAFGKVDSDISRAFFERDVLINVKNLVGTVNITIPEGVNVKVISHSLFGGVTNPVQNNDSNVVTIYIEALCLLGNVEVKKQVNNYNAGTNFNF